jgi:CHAT domain-containing protein/tetratricopeptide (TPR) repeat protein
MSRSRPDLVIHSLAEPSCQEFRRCSARSPWRRALEALALLAALHVSAPVGAAPVSDAGRGASAAAAAEQEAGRHEQALAQWKEALAQADSAGDAAARARAHLGLGTSYVALGRPGPALEQLRRAEALAAASGDPRLTIGVTAAIGNAEVLAGRPEGRATLGRALAQAEQAGARDLAARVGNDLASVLAGSGERQRAIELYRSALAGARAAGDDALTAQVAVNLARALQAVGRAQEAASPLALAQEAARRLPPSHTKSSVLISAARLQTAAKAGSGRARAAADLDEAIASARATGDARMLSYALGYRAELEAAAGRSGDALALSRDAAHYAQLAGAPEALYRWQWQTARLLRDQGDANGAITAYRLAVASMEAVRRDLPTAGAGGGFREQAGPLYLELVDALLKRSGRSGDATAAQADLGEARLTLEQLKSAELEDYFRDDCVAALKSKTRGIDSLDGQTAAIYPIVLPDRLAVLLSLPDGLRLYTTPVRSAKLAQEVHALRSGFEKRTTREFMPHARQVYDWLVRPLRGDLEGAGIATLVFVPDGVLRTIPLAALHDGSDFLVARYAVATSPGLTLTDPRPLRDAKPRMLVGALTESVQGFPPLPAVADEVAALDAIFGGTVLADAQFNAAGFERAIERRPYSIVHVASHGEFGSTVGDTFVLTHDSRITLDQLEAQLGSTAYRDQPVELLALSACQTASGDDRAALGLGGVAVKAGARSALATLWSVSDRASTILVSAFYERLQKDGMSKAQALRAAQQVLLADKRYRHPAYWAPFLLIGNWL